MSFLAPWHLLLLIGVAALAVAYVLQQRRRSSYAVRWTNLDLLDSVAPDRPGWRRHAPAVAFLLMALLLVIAFARPAQTEQVARERATIIVAIDTSLSMEATDVSPSRLAAAKQAASSFVDDLPDSFNVGLVSFSGTAAVVVPPTTQHGAVKDGISALTLGPATAIGDAVLTSLQSLASVPPGRDGSPPPARIVLMSDGTSTVGSSPSAAAAQARKLGVEVSTIAYGTPYGSVVAQGHQIPVPVDPDALKALADATGGSSFQAKSGEQLTKVYGDIGSAVGYRTETREITGWFIGFGLLAALAAGLASLRWFSRLP